MKDVEIGNEIEKEEKNRENEMRYIFQQFDRNNDGKISKDELRYLMNKMFPDEEINDFDIDNMLDEADLDQNGIIDYNGKQNIYIKNDTLLSKILTSIF